MGFLGRASSTSPRFLPFSHSPEPPRDVCSERSPQHVLVVYIDAVGMVISSRLPSTKEAVMIAIFKNVGVVACGFVLSVSLSQQIMWAADEMKASHSSSRIGGQAGQSYDHAKRTHVSFPRKERIDGRPGERLGGQAGREYDHIKHDYEPIYATGRIGGRAGASYSPIQLE
jgi:hypothetical protein